MLVSIGHLGGGATVSDWPGDRGELANRAADAEVVGVHHATVHFDFLAFKADVGDPMLAATVRASGDVQLQLLIETGDAIFERLDEPASEAFRFGKSELAKFRPGASDRPARKY